jgi:hypothetical protein
MQLFVPYSVLGLLVFFHTAEPAEWMQCPPYSPPSDLTDLEQNLNILMSVAGLYVRVCIETFVHLSKGNGMCQLDSSFRLEQHEQRNHPFLGLEGEVAILESYLANLDAQRWSRYLLGGVTISYLSGGDGGQIIPWASILLDTLGQGYDIYLPDHRGTGKAASFLMLMSCRILLFFGMTEFTTETYLC